MDDSSTGLKPNVVGLLCYLFAWVSGLVLYLVETKSQFVRFHAAQSIIVFGSISIATIVLTVIPFIGWAINALLGLLFVVLWIILMIKAYQGEKYKLPIAGDLAEQWAAKKI
ncbi:hypothetical protein DGWBC_1174 [Dehalogenimonas sp. WBC-2]|nr:hypothetical protein DGWBC_1174 [Dehalogenimonas sp. WBC-2]